MLALAILVASIWLGFSLMRLCGLHLHRRERLVVGPVVGVAVGFFVLYVLSSAAGAIVPGVPVAFLVGVVLVALLARTRPAPPREEVDRWFVVLAAVVALAFLTLNLWGNLAPDPQGSVRASEHIWADTPFHAAQVTSFAYRDNFPPMWTIAHGEPLTYPFLVNFVSGVLVREGLPFRAGWIATSLLFQTAFLLALALVTLRLTGSPLTAATAVGVFFFLGNLGFLAVPRDVVKEGGFLAWLSDVPWSYTGDALGGPGRERLGTGLYLGNPVYIYMLPERSSAFGLAALGALWLLFDELRERPAIPAALVAGLLLGVLPRIHVHAVAMMLVVVGVWFVCTRRAPGERRVRAWRRAFPVWTLAGAVALVLAGPQVSAMTAHTSGFLSIWPGWAGEPHDAFMRVGALAAREWPAAIARAAGVFLRFWVLNAGVLLVLVVLAFRRADRRLRIWYAPFLAVFVLANVVKTQPWEWDQNNFFIYWQAASCVLVAPLLASLFRGATTERAADTQSRLFDPGPPVVPAPRRRPSVVRIVTGLSLVFLLCFGGVLSYVYWAQHRHFLWSAEEMAFAAWFRDHTPPDAVVLTSNGHTHPVLALSGRQGYMGFPGWLSVDNLDWRTYEERLKRMYGGDVGLMRALGIDYVVIGPWERDFTRGAGVTISPAFDDPDVFRVAHAATLGGQEWRVLRLRRPL